MRIAICDDEQEIREILAEKVRKLYPGAELALYRTGEELLAGRNEPDICFLDIQMPGRDGMETARELRKRSTKTILIFVTAIEEYVFQAFDVGAFHYLVKPFSDEKFASVLCNAAEQYQKSAEVTEKEEKCMMIKTGGTHTKVMINEIIYAEVFNRKVMIHKPDGDIEYYGKLSELQEQAGEDFFRPHRAYLVNFKYVVKYDKSVIYLERGTALIAKQNYPEFVKQYLKYNQRRGRRI